MEFRRGAGGGNGPYRPIAGNAGRLAGIITYRCAEFEGFDT
jgi:hypothetical protein